MNKNIPLIVDLDNTFLKTDVFYESILVFLKNNPFRFYYLIFWLIKGNLPYLKYKIAEVTPLNFRTMPLSREFYSYLQSQKGQRLIYLFTGTTQKYADEVAKIYPLFDYVIGSTRTVNYTASKKLTKLEEIGITAFDYAGDRKADIKIFKESILSLIVNPSLYLRLKKKTVKNHQLFDYSEYTTGMLRTLCSKAWLINLVIFFPILIEFSKFIYRLPEFFWGYITVGLLGTGSGLFRLLLNLHHERQKNSQKKRHPSISGVIGIGETAALIFILLSIGLISLCVNFELYFQFCALTYLGVNMIYPFLAVNNRRNEVIIETVNIIVILYAGYLLALNF